MLTIGMLWQIEDQRRPLAEHVQQATDYYTDKYGQRPTHAYVHPAALAPDGAPRQVGIVQVRALRTVIAGHLWLGVETVK